MTSIEWLINQLTNVKYNPLEKNGYSKAVEKIHEEAKEMHKQEIINAHIEGDKTHSIGLTYDKVAEQYYQETFKKQ